MALAGSNYLIAVILGVMGAASAGSYGFFNYIKEQGTQQLENNEKQRLVAEFFEKESFDNSKISCTKLLKSTNIETFEEKKLDDQECQKVVNEKWKNKNQEQPWIWINVNKQEVEKVLRKYNLLFGDVYHSQEPKDKKSWFEGFLGCVEEKDSSNDQKVVVTCKKNGDESKAKSFLSITS
ncbi:hypothetical protein [Mycoplasma suis]|uniref:Uncharacterized protein n=1 Tax=Mycoplasma suis (strain Illinois) TaxID=768700 RepID=F0QQN5_MYCSL|nr:hypothetical protein [Mycoplasma suis]ADX97805.1 hypothetical protein MSU_0261 [Mycoplasma suis str. Illinois]